MSKLLINEYPLLVLPTLAAKIGLNEAIVLQQIHYWTEANRRRNSANHFIDGRWWTYNTISEWAEQFPFWSESTVKRTLLKLRDMELVIAKSHGNDWDKTLWYSICYSRLGQFDPIDKVKPAIIDKVNLTPSTYYTETNTTEISSREGGDGEFMRVVNAYEQNIGTITQAVSRAIENDIADYPAAWLVEAIDIAALNNARSYKYIAAILKRWGVEGKDDGQRSKKTAINEPAGYEALRAFMEMD